MNTWGPITTIDVAGDDRPSEIYRALCAYAGVEITPERTGPGETIVREGYASPYAKATELRAVLGDDNATVMAFPRTVDGLQVGTTWAAISRDGRHATVCRQ